MQCSACTIIVGPGHLEALVDNQGRCEACAHGHIYNTLGVIELLGEILKPGREDPAFFLTPNARFWCVAAGLDPQTLYDEAMRNLGRPLRPRVKKNVYNKPGEAGYQIT